MRADTRRRLVPLDAPPQPLLTVRQVAARLGVCTATVYALCERGDLPHVRISNSIRIAPADLDAFIRSSSGKPSSTPNRRRKPEKDPR